VTVRVCFGVCVCVCVCVFVGLGGIRVNVVQTLNSSAAVDMDRGCGRATLRQPYRIHDQGQIPVQATLRRQQRRGPAWMSRFACHVYGCRASLSLSVSPSMSAKCAADKNVDGLSTYCSTPYRAAHLIVIVHCSTPYRVAHLIIHQRLSFVYARYSTRRHVDVAAQSALLGCLVQDMGGVLCKTLLGDVSCARHGMQDTEDMQTAYTKESERAGEEAAHADRGRSKP